MNNTSLSSLLQCGLDPPEAYQQNRARPSVLSVWREQLAQNPRLQQRLLNQEQEILPRFAAQYTTLNALPRRARRAMQRQWKRSLAGVALLLVMGQTPALAATINVGGGCRLVDAITAANSDADTGGCPKGSGADTIVLPQRSVQRLTRVNNTYGAYGATGLPVITSAITIAGSDSTIRRAQTAPAFRILTVGAGGDLTLRRITVSGGKAQGFRGTGGIYVAGTDAGAGTLTVVNSTISGNTGNGLIGAGDDASLSLTVRRSTISGNRGSGLLIYGYGGYARVIDSTIANNTGVGIGASRGVATITNSTVSGNQGGGVIAGQYYGGVKIYNSTISGNSRAGYGGGVFVSGDGSASIVHSTITGNSAQSGGGIFVYYYYGSGSLQLQRSIVSGNQAVKGREISAHGDSDYLSSEFNLIGQRGRAGSVGFPLGDSDIVPAQPIGRVLNTRLAANGGPTSTHALVARSPAIDAISDGTCPPPGRDQRGVVRPRDGNGDGGPACDIGAVER